jgi:Ca-activated chloride channel family protein
VSKAAAEVRKFLRSDRVNRIILLSDGLANVGPATPAELAEMGSSLKKEGVSVSTIGLGLGYNDELMSRLADHSDGNHWFVENPRDLARIFDTELGDLLSVAAQEIVVRVECAPGTLPVRVLGRHAEIVGREVIVNMNHVNPGREKYVLLELDVGTGADGSKRPAASVHVSYLDMIDGARKTVEQPVAVAYSADPLAVERATDPAVVVAVVEQVATERNQVAIALRDQGEVKQAEDVLLANVDYVHEYAKRFDSNRLRSLAETNRQDAEQLDAESWDATRKKMREKAQIIRQQQIEPVESPE